MQKFPIPFNLTSITLFFLSTILVSCTDGSTEPDSPAEVAGKVADRLVEMTVFETYKDTENAVQDNNIRIDFFDNSGQDEENPDAVFLARFSFQYEADTDTNGVLLGLSQTAGLLEILLNGNPIHSRNAREAQEFAHTDYGLFRYGTMVPLQLKNGGNTIEFRYQPSGESAVLHFGLIRSDNGLRNPAVTYLTPADRSHPVEISGPYLNMSGTDADQAGSEWTEPRLHEVTRLRGTLDLSDWRYFTGTFLDALITLQREHPDLDYSRYVNTHLDFFLQHKDQIAEERREYGLRESAFGHYFRYNLLDDIGMQAVPYVERIRENFSSEYEDSPDYELVKNIADFILHDADRLPDGTWARFTPDTMTVWADDLFMASIVLNRMTLLTGDERYIGESAKQTILFDSHLRDEATNLYWHGYYSRNNTSSSSKWGRANGWTMMAKTDLLLHLDPVNPLHEEVLSIFQRHSDGLKNFQSEEGLWHQILDNPETYLETSCSAMFVRAFAEGVMQGWLDREEYDEIIMNGWDAVVRQIDEDGTVNGIVRGTPIMFSDEEYDNWSTRPHDPRGLGAVLFAASAMQRYLDFRN